MRYPRDEGPRVEAGVGARCDRHAVSREEFSCRRGGALGRLHHSDHVEAKRLGEFKVAVVVCRHGHDRSGAIRGQHIVGHPDRDGCARERMHDARAGKHARFVAGQVGAVEVALSRRRLAIRADRLTLRRRRERVEQRMLRCDDHEGHAVERVGAGRVDAEHIIGRPLGQAGFGTQRFPLLVGRITTVSSRDEEIDLGAGAPADPVALELLDARGPVEALEFAVEPVSVGGDPQHPLPQRNSHHRMTAPLADPADHLLVGQHRAERRAPVHRRLRLVGEPVSVAVGRDGRFTLAGDLGGDRQFGDRPALLQGGVEPGVEELEENPLRPADVFGVGRCQRTVPVVTEAEHLQLTAERVDVALGALPRRRAGADRMLLRRQAEGVEAHRMHHGRAPHPLEPGHDVGGGVALWVAHVQPVATGVGEHVEHIRLAARRQPRRGEGAVRVPPGLPLRFDLGRLVAGHLGDPENCARAAHGKGNEPASG